MNILVLCDDRWHPASVVRGGLAGLGGDLRFDVIEDAAEWSAGQMAQYPVVLLAKSNNQTAQDETPWMTPSVELAFQTYVEGGGGLLVVHSGSAGYQDTALLRSLLGGVFDHHPPQCAVTVTPAPEHPLAGGVQPFTETDEHYFMELDDPSADVFLMSSSEHGSQPAGWLRRQGAGRVCVLTPGHNLPVWQTPSYQVLLRNAIAWCAGLHD